MRRLKNQQFIQKLLPAYRVFRKIPDYYFVEQAMAARASLPWSGNRVMFGDRNGKLVSVYAPAEDDDGNIQRSYDIFRYHASARQHKREVAHFMDFAKSSSSLLDLGSAEGLFSALFAAIQSANARIVSVDCGAPEGCIFEHLYLTRQTNMRHSGCRDWRIKKAFLTDSRMVTQIKSPDAAQLIPFTLAADCEITTLPALCRQLDFRPDLIKLDIESSEYEVLLDSLDFLSELRPKLCIELHNEVLARRGLSGETVFDRLTSIGYELIHTDKRDWRRAAYCHLFLAMRRN